MDNGTNRFAAKVAIVTGSGRGIGKAIAEKLAREGASVVIADMNGEAAGRTVSELNERGLKAVAARVDVTKSDEVNDMVRRAVDSFGGVDILVNNAGILGRKPLEEIEEDEWDRVFAVNAKGTYLCCRAAIPYMKQRTRSANGKIINISSVAALIPRQNQTHYCGSKAAIIQISRVLALELAAYRINVNVLCPGMTDTEMIGPTLRSDPQAMSRWVETVPMGRLARPEDHANAVAFLASQESNHITGQVFTVDGGQSINFSHGFGKNIFTISLTQ